MQHYSATTNQSIKPNSKSKTVKQTAEQPSDNRWKAFLIGLLTLGGMAAANSSSKTNATNSVSPLTSNEGFAGNAGTEMLGQDPLLQPLQQPLQAHQHFETSTPYATDPVAHPSSSYSSPSTSFMLSLLAYQQSTSVTAACLTGLTSYLSTVDSQELPALIDLATLTPEQGITITGATAGEKIGSIGAGDVTNRRDTAGRVVEEKIIIGAPNADPLNRTDAGMIYVIKTSQSLTAKVDLANLNVEQTTGTKIVGGAAGDHCGKVVSKTTKDFNGDGIPDFAFSAPDADPYGRLSAGTIVIFYGSFIFDATTLNTMIDLKDLDPSIGLLIHGGSAGDYCGGDVELIDDVNGDNRAEVLFGCPSASAGTFRSKNGVTFIVYGAAVDPGPSLGTNGLDLSKFDEKTQGMKILGDNSQDYSGQSVAFGDGDADGKGDIFIYAAGTSVINSKFYMLSSQVVPLKGLYDLSKFNNSQGILVNGGTGGYYADDLITTLRDVNGDAKNDFAAAFPLATANRLTGAGNVLVMYGSSSLRGTFSLTNINASQGMIIWGPEAGAKLGSTLTDAGNYTGDTKSALLIGAVSANPLNRKLAGMYYILRGSDKWPATLDSAQFNASHGVVIYGAAAGDGLGNSAFNIQAANENNGGTGRDVLLCASNASAPGKSAAGACYRLFKPASNTPVTRPGETTDIATTGLPGTGPTATSQTNSNNATNIFSDPPKGGILESITSSVGALVGVGSGIVALLGSIGYGTYKCCNNACNNNSVNSNNRSYNNSFNNSNNGNVNFNIINVPEFESARNTPPSSRW